MRRLTLSYPDGYREKIKRLKKSGIILSHVFLRSVDEEIERLIIKEKENALTNFAGSGY